MTHNICFILLAVDKENNNDPLKIWGLYLFVLAFLGECVNQLGSEVKSIPERSAGWFKTLDVWHRLMLCDIKKNSFIDMKFGINQAISQTITQLSCIQLETPSSRLWNFWWIKTYTTFKFTTRRDHTRNSSHRYLWSLFPFFHIDNNIKYKETGIVRATLLYVIQMCHYSGVAGIQCIIWK